MNQRPSRYVLIPKFCDLVGYTDKAVRRKIEEGIWREGHGGVFVQATAGRLLDGRELDEAPK